jgi:AraC family transcriptional regulator, exoenzyme S synthesis regulatory protein ExsA
MILDHKRFDLFEKMIFEKAVLKAPFIVPAVMPNEACFLYVLQGQQISHAATDNIPLGPKDAILMKCGTYMGQWLASSNYQQCVAIAVHLYPDVLKKIYENDIPDFIKQYKKGITTVSAHKIAGDELVDNFIKSLEFYFENPQLVDDELIKLKLKELILLLTKTEKSASIMALISDLFSPKEVGFKQIIDTHIYSNLGVDELAALCNLSLSSFKREFAKIYNDSPAQYLKNKKIERGAELLTLSNQRISEIAYDCGFADVSHFSKSFHEKYGVSPSQYRLSQTNQ